MHLLIYSAICLIAVTHAPMSAAQSQWPRHLDVDLNYRNSAPLPADRWWDLRLGLGLESEPSFQGSDSNETGLEPFAVAAWRGNWGNLFLAGADGIGYSRVFGDRFGLLLKLEAEDTRQEDDDSRLTGLGDQEDETELEIVGQYFWGPWRAGGSIAFATGDKGTVWFVGGGRSWRLAGGRLFVNLGADLSGSDADNQRTDFGITPAQSAASTQGFPVYEPDGGLKSLGLRLSLDFALTRRWFLNGELDYERLLGDVADSPLVQQGGSQNNYEVSVGAYYKF